MLSRLSYSAVRALGIPALARRLKNAGVILCYHNVVSLTDQRGVGEPGVHLPADRFAWQMRWLATHYHVVSLREYVDRLLGGRSLRGIAAVTFDDGYTGVFAHAWPVLSDLGIPATAFIVADAPKRSDGFWWDHPAVVAAATPAARERWLGELAGDGARIVDGAPPAALPRSHQPADWPTIRAAARAGLSLGAHSASHRVLPRLSDDELEREVRASRDTIRREADIVPEFFAYPYGLWDDRVRSAARAAGYRAAVTLDAGLNPPGTDPWALRRVNVPASITSPSFEAWAAGLCPAWRAR